MLQAKIQFSLILAMFFLQVSVSTGQESQTVRREIQSFKIIVNPANPDTAVSISKLSRMFTKKVTRWSNGLRVFPVDQPEQSKLRHTFTRAIHGKDISAIKAYWQVQIFSGRGVPPPEKKSGSDVVQYVKDHRGAVGYVSTDCPLGGLKELRISR